MFNKMKRKMFFRLAVTCLVAVSALIACTKDYESDIKELQNKVDGLSQQVADLDKLIKDGYVITDVSSITGGTRVTLSNGEHFDVTNGKDGNDGEDGKDGTVWTIGDNGNWFCDGVDSGKPSKGADGTDGTNGTDGVDGKSAYELAKDAGFTGTEDEWIASLKGEKGDKGRNGDYYYPCVDKESANYKHWIKVDGETGAETPQEALWLSDDVVTAVWDEDSEIITFHNVEGAEDGIVEISLSVGLSSLAIIPEVWDAKIGMPMAQLYAIMPTAMETARVFAKSGKFPRLLEWANVYASTIENPADFWGKFWCVIWSSYLRANNGFDVFANNFNYRWADHQVAHGNPSEMDYGSFVQDVDEAVAILGERLANQGAESWIVRRPPVSVLDLKYRVSPAGADLGGYTYRMIDRSLRVDTKADGDKFDAVVIDNDASSYNKKDQLNIKAYVDYFKLWADMPVEWYAKMRATKHLAVWFYYQAADDPTEIPTRWGAADASYQNLTSSFPAINGNATTNLDMAAAWLQANNTSYQAILALEASKNGRGAEAVVSDYMTVKMDYVTPIWTAYYRRYIDTEGGNDPTAQRWRIACNQVNRMEADFKNNPNKFVNDYLVVGQNYNVASHMRFADPYYGRLENLGFEVKYDYYVFSQAHAADITSSDGVNGRYDQNVWSAGGEYEWNYGAWDKVNCTADGVVSVKADATEAIGKYVMITADASIYNPLDGTYYTSSVPKGATQYGSRLEQFDEYAAQYVLLIVPDSSKAKNVTFDLGDIDYLATKYVGKTLAPFKALESQLPDPDNRDHKWADALDMDLEGFLNVYKPAALTSTLPTGFTADYVENNEMFNVTITNQIKLGKDEVTYTFDPKPEFAEEYPQVCYTIKWNVVINWAETEPILNPNYILYDDKARTQLTPTIINPDPATLSLTGNNYVAGAWKNHRTESTDLTKVPYVDSIVSVKGKAVDGVWKPQTSIKEHIKDYGQYLDAQPNVSNLSMSIDWANTKYSDGTPVANTSAEIFKIAESTPTYQYQQMIMKEAFHPYEEYRDYLVNISVKLANGTEKIVKAYIVRFVNPFVLKVTDVVLHTHRNDWCAKQSNILICDVDKPSIVIYDFANRTFNQDYVDIYPGLADALAQEANRPKWFLEQPVDPSFGTILENGYETEHLRVDTTSAWFYWANGGTNLQENKETTFEVTLNVPAIAELAAKGKVTVLSVANSNVFHEECDAQNPKPQPGDHSNPTWEIIFE